MTQHLVKGDDMSKETGPTRRDGFPSSTMFDMRAGADRLQAEARAVAAMRERSAPPPDMAAAPSAPARGAMQLVAQYDMQAGGMRRRAGAHWRAVCLLTAMNADAAKRSADGDAVLPFTPAHLETAAKYRALVEWRAGSGIKGQNFDATRSGDGDGFIDRFIDKGAALDAVHAAIGYDIALSPRRHMDRGNSRHSITVRAVVDKAVLAGQGLGLILEAYGWQNDGRNRKHLRAVICAALDRMRNHL